MHRLLILLLLATALHAQQRWAPGEQALYERSQELMKAGRAKEAVPLAERRLALALQAFGKSSESAVSALNTLANCCLEAGDAARATQAFQQAMKTSTALHGDDDSWKIPSLRGLGRIAALEGKYAEALPYLKRALKSAETVLGKDDLTTLLMAEDLAQALGRQGDYREALPLFQRVLSGREAKLGADSTGAANAAMNLGIACEEVGQLERAEQLYLRAVAVHEKVSGPEHPSTAVALARLAEFYRGMLDYERAVPLFARAFAIKEKVLSLEHPATITALHGLGAMLSSLRQYDKAVERFELAARVAEKVLGPSHVMTIRIKADYGSALRELGRADEAIVQLSIAVEALEKLQGTDAADLFTPLNNLALAKAADGKLPEAEALLRRALALAERLGGPEGELAYAARSNLVWTLNDEKKTSEARQIAGAQLQHDCRLWADLLSFGTEEQLENVYRKVSNNGVGESLGDANLAATAVLRFKDSLTGVMLDRLRIARAAESGTANAKLAAAVQASRRKLRELAMLQQPDGKAMTQAREVAENAEKAWLRKLNAASASSFDRELTPQAVAAVLPPATTLVEFTLHSVHDVTHGLNPPVIGIYSAILIAKDRAPVLVSLGEMPAVNGDVAALRKAISEPGAKPDEAVETASKAVYQRILAPVISALPEGTQTLVLSPDSILHGVPFAALLGPGDRFLGESYTVRYVASGRDLLHPPRLISGKKSALLVGDPNFQLPVNLKHATRSPGLSEVGRGMLFSPLPGTASEVSAIKEKLIQQKWGVTLVTREAATEKALVSSPTAALLHVATHGFFLDQGKTTAVLRGSGSSPMARSMANSALVLAGGNTTMRQWAAGSAPPPEDDGILTATEITEMLLDRTELVTLSACDTGLGTMISGQGVAGMKRAFFIAGAHQVLTTLWQVNDEETTRFMIDFYQRVASGEEPGGALSSTQAESLQRLRKSGGLWSAINGAGPFVLTSASRW